MHNRHADLYLGSKRVTILVSETTPQYLRRSFNYEALGIKANRGWRHVHPVRHIQLSNDLNVWCKRCPREAKIPVNRSVIPVTLIKKLIPQHRTIFLYSWCVGLIGYFYDLIYAKWLRFYLQISQIV
jgi:hypothetical protein